MIDRKNEKQVENWIANGKDALLLTGARQIGKTFLIRECLKKSKNHFVELNFIESRNLIEVFQNAKSSDDILLRLTVVCKEPLKRHETIIFLDEIQEYKEIMTQIKFLVEEGSYRYIMSGSLLGVELYNMRSAPVGYVSIIDMFPLDFLEFIGALGIQTKTIQHIQNCYQSKTQVDSFIHEKMLDLFYLYMIVGGMPEAVETYINTNDLQKVKFIHDKIIRFYKEDFTKYEVNYKLHLREIYNAIPSELGSKSKRFKISAIGGKTRYASLENDFIWLKDAGVALPVYNVTEPKEPLLLSQNRSLFKLFLSDVGLLTSQFPDIIKLKILNKEQNINNGGLFENAVAQELFAHRVPVYYFNSKKQGELDFVIELDGEVCPIEVKSGKDYKKHSALTNVLSCAEYEIKKAYILSNSNVEVNGKLTYLPIYMIACMINSPLTNTIYKIDICNL